MTAFAPLWPPPGCADPAAFYASLGLDTPDGVDPVEHWTHGEPEFVPLGDDPTPDDVRHLTYYLGTHEVSWLWDDDVAASGARLFINFGRFQRRQSLPQKPKVPFAIDSGAFSQLDKHGEWSITTYEYLLYVLDLFEQGLADMLDFAAPQDWPCEPVMLAKTGLSVRAHQHLTVQNFVRLWDLWPHDQYRFPFIPVLQGWTLEDFLYCVDLYAQYGVRLSRFKTVGVGSVCRRQDTSEAEVIMRTLADMGLPIHAFGFKVNGLKKVARYVHSADSLAWSLDAYNAGTRKRDTAVRRMPGCTHKTCANCKHWALAWLDRLRETIGLDRPAPWRTREQALSDLFDELMGIAS